MLWILLAVFLGLKGCSNEQSTQNNNTHGSQTSPLGNRNQIPENEFPRPEPNQPVASAKLVDMAFNDKGGCALDAQGKTTCWRHPTTFIPFSPGATKGSYEITYPKKSNKELASISFEMLRGFENFICGITKGKLACFTPTDSIKKKASDLAAGTFKKIAANGQGYYCVIDQKDHASCHLFDVTSTKASDDFRSSEDISDLALGKGSTGPGGSLANFACLLTSLGSLSCQTFSATIEATPPVEKAIRFAPWAGSLGGIAILLPDQKTIKYLSPSNIKAAKRTQTDLSGPYENIIIQNFKLCSTDPSSQKLECQESNNLSFGEQSNSALQKHSFNQITLGFIYACGLSADKKAFCWDFKNYEPGIPEHILAQFE